MAKASQRLYLDADGGVVVEGDPSAAFLLASKGAEIPDGYAEPSAKQSDKPKDKAAPAPANKSVKKAAAKKSAD